MRRYIVLGVAIAAVLLIAYALLTSGPDVPDQSVLVLPVQGELADAPAMDTLARFFAPGLALPTLVLQLDKAAEDERIAAVLLHIRPLQAGFAQIQELRDGISRVRARDKQVIALLDLETLNATRALYLAAAADRVYLVPGYLGPLGGIAGQYLHLGGFLARLGIVVEYERIGAYKAAPEMFGATGMSEPARENANALLDGLFEQIVSGIAEGRDLPRSRVRALFDETPSTGAEYLGAGLADGIADRSEVLEAAELGDASEVPLETYLHVDPRDVGLRDGPAVALVFGHGTILSGRGGPGARGFAAQRIASALESAGEDPDVRAIVLRVDSGGGSALASERLWRVIQRLREKAPVVISMGNAAASGGYYLASAANTIVAEPATLTGSIGVFFLRPSFAGMYEKLDIDAEVLARGSFASLAASDRPFTAQQRERARTFVSAMYDEFVDRVASGRDIAPEQVDQLGQGRVFLGQVALAHGLIDATGGLHAAVELAKKEAGIAPELDPERRLFPGPRPLGQQIQELVSGELRSSVLGQLLPRPLPRVFESVSLLLDGELAYLPPYWLELH